MSVGILVEGMVVGQHVELHFIFKLRRSDSAAVEKSSNSVAAAKESLLSFLLYFGKLIGCRKKLRE